MGRWKLLVIFFLIAVGFIVVGIVDDPSYYYLY